MRHIRALVALPALLVIAMGSLAEAQSASARRGEALARETCGRCHGVTLTDRSRHAQAPSFRRIAIRYPPEQMEEALAEGISVGHPDMPEFELSPRQIDDLIAHLKRLRRR